MYSVWWLGYGVGRSGVRFPPGTRDISFLQNIWRLPTYLHLFPLLKMGGAILLYVLYAVMVCIDTAFHDLTHLAHYANVRSLGRSKNLEQLQFLNVWWCFPCGHASRVRWRGRGVQKCTLLGNYTGSRVVILCLIVCGALELLFSLTSLVYIYVLDHMCIHFWRAQN